MGVWIETHEVLQKNVQLIVAPYAGALIEKVEVGEGRLHTFLCERNFYFFSPCVKYVFDFHRPPLSQFFGLFCTFLVEVGGGHLQTFLCERKISRRLQSGLPIPIVKLQSL